MRHCRGIIYSLIGALSIIAISCKKENKTFPTVEIESPAEGRLYEYGDTISVVARVGRRDGPVRVSILQGATVKNFGVEKTYDGGEEVWFDLFYIDRYLPSGEYDLRITAFNGDNGTSQFLKIKIKELPLEFQGLALLSQSASSSELTISTAGAAPITHFLGDDFRLLAVNNIQQRVAVAPHIEGNLSGFDFKLENKYSLTGTTGPGLQQFDELLSNEDLIYAFDHEGLIKAINADGQTARSFNLSSELIPVKAVFGDGNLLLATKEKGKELYHLLLLNPQNGAILKQTNIGGRPLALGYSHPDHFAVAWNEGGKTVISDYNLQSNLVSRFDEIPNQQATAMLELPNGNLLVATGQSILKFNLQKQQLPTEVYNFGAVDMAYEKLSGEVYLAKGLSILKAVPGNPTVLAFTATSPILQMDLIYNK